MTNTNDLRKRMKKKKDEENAEKGKTGRTGKPQKLTSKEVKQNLEGLSTAIVKVEGQLEGVRANADGAHTQSLLVNRRLNMVMQESNRIFGELEERTRELRDDLDSMIESHLGLIDTLVEKGIIDPEPEPEEDAKEGITDKVNSAVEEKLKEADKEESAMDVPSLDELKDSEKKVKPEPKAPAKIR